MTTIYIELAPWLCHCFCHMCVKDNEPSLKVSFILVRVGMYPLCETYNCLFKGEYSYLLIICPLKFETIFNYKHLYHISELISTLVQVPRYYANFRTISTEYKPPRICLLSVTSLLCPFTSILIRINYTTIPWLIIIKINISFITSIIISRKIHYRSLQCHLPLQHYQLIVDSLAPPLEFSTCDYSLTDTSTTNSIFILSASSFKSRTIKSPTLAKSNNFQVWLIWS